MVQGCYIGDPVINGNVFSVGMLVIAEQQDIRFLVKNGRLRNNFIMIIGLFEEKMDLIFCSIVQISIVNEIIVKLRALENLKVVSQKINIYISNL